MDEVTKTGNAMNLAERLTGAMHSHAPTESAITNNIEKSLKENKMATETVKNIFTTPSTDGGMMGLGGGGVVGGLLLGSLLSRGGLFGNGVGAAEAAVASRDPVLTQMLSQDLGDIKAGVATSALETQKAVSASTAEVVNTISTQSADIQASITANAIAGTNGFANVNQSIASSTSALKDVINTSTISNLQGQFQLGSAIAGLNANVDKNTFALAAAINNDGDKTRSLITAQYEATLNRELVAAQNEIAELRNDHRGFVRAKETEVNVTNNITQNQNQLQAQAQMQTISNAVAVLAGEIQRNSQSIVNLGSMSSGAGQQSAANTKVY